LNEEFSYRRFILPNTASPHLPIALFPHLLIFPHSLIRFVQSIKFKTFLANF